MTMAIIMTAMTMTTIITDKQQIIFIIIIRPDIIIAGATEERKVDKIHHVPCTRHGTRDTGHETRDTRHETRDTRHETRDTRHETRDTSNRNASGINSLHPPPPVKFLIHSLALLYIKCMPRRWAYYY